VRASYRPRTIRDARIARPDLYPQTRQFSRRATWKHSPPAPIAILIYRPKCRSRQIATQKNATRRRLARSSKPVVPIGFRGTDRLSGNDHKSNPSGFVDTEIRTHDHAIVCVVARAIGLEVESKAFGMLVAEINERGLRVHDTLIAYLSAHHLYLRRAAEADAIRNDDARAKLYAASIHRERRARILSDALGEHRAAHPTFGEHPTPPEIPMPGPSRVELVPTIASTADTAPHVRAGADDSDES
jgi:hypothetical protein